MFEIDPAIWRMCFQLVLAVALGLMIGFEREYHGKAAGLRTYALVALGACLFSILSAEGFKQFALYDSFDPSRIASQIVVGIGFIGGGLIFLQDDKVRGLTTAAGIWTVAAIGMAVGLGFYTISLFATLLTLCILWLLRVIEGRLLRERENAGNINHNE